MHIERLILKNFRNYSFADVKLGEKKNILIGQNAQGKTNLAEAIYYLCVGKSLRTPREKELIKWDTDRAYVRADAIKSSGKVKIEAYLTRTENRRVSINGIPIRRMGELMGAVNAVLFSPTEMRIIKDAPADRRRFMDIDLSQLSKRYFYCLSRYNKIIAQRNKLLKSGKNINETLDIWDSQLAREGAVIAHMRSDFVKKLARHAYEAHKYLAGNEELNITYEGICLSDESCTEKGLYEQLQRDRELDILRGYTNSGVHKDDIAITVNNIDLRSYGSQGQQRTAALALKLAELEIFAEEAGEYPVLILDDVLSELDVDRQKRLLERINNVQSIITCTRFNYDQSNARLFSVSDGSITQI